MIWFSVLELFCSFVVPLLLYGCAKKRENDKQKRQIHQMKEQLDLTSSTEDNWVDFLEEVRAKDDGTTGTSRSGEDPSLDDEIPSEQKNVRPKLKIPRLNPARSQPRTRAISTWFPMHANNVSPIARPDSVPNPQQDQKSPPSKKSGGGKKDWKTEAEKLTAENERLAKDLAETREKLMLKTKECETQEAFKTAIMIALDGFFTDSRAVQTISFFKNCLQPN